MDSLKQYIMTVTFAAILCGITTGILGKKGTTGAATKFLTGLFLVITVIAPVTKIKFQDIQQYTDGISQEAADLTKEGENFATETMARIITERAESYILDKAAAMSVDLQVEVTLSDAIPPMPWAVSLSGSVSPYEKRRLEQCICKDLGISEEEITWTSQK